MFFNIYRVNNHLPQFYKIGTSSILHPHQGPLEPLEIRIQSYVKSQKQNKETNKTEIGP